MNRRLRIKNILKLLIVILNIVLAGLLFVYYQKHKSLNVKLLEVKEKDKKITFRFNEDIKCSLDKKKYVKSKDKKCIFDFNYKIKKVYTKDKNNNVKVHKINKDLSKITGLELKDKKFYLALESSKKISYEVKYDGVLYEEVSFKSSNDGIAKVDKDGVVTAVSPGEVTITLSIDKYSKELKVLSTDLITKRPEEFDYGKPYIECGRYSKEDNDLFDEILEARINDVGYKTRAGAVESARFLTLEFPYRITYFSENGRLNGYPTVDGEGRYYHKGLYLDSSRFENLNKDLIMHGPNPWGCPIYSNPSEGIRSNGLDCSGFISWVIYQAGFDPTDMGAGVSPGQQDYTDLGPLTRTGEALDQGRVKVGDLLSGDGEVTDAWFGGHIAMLVGIKDGNFYVAEELWWSTGIVGAVIKKYDREQFLWYFYWHVDMSEFYGEDGKLTDYWL